MFLKALLSYKTEGFDEMYQDVVGGGRASIILSRDVGLLRVLCGSQHPASAALKLHQQGGGELTCFFALIMISYIVYMTTNIFLENTFNLGKLRYKRNSPPNWWP